MKRILLFIFAFVLSGLTSFSPLYAKSLPAGFDFQGHRGARGIYPENTIPGFNYAAELGVTTLELDIQLTADQIPVICHNPYLAHFLTQYNGKWIDPANEPVISKMTLAQLKKYTVGETNPDSSYYKSKTPGQKVVLNTKVPTLEELFQNVNEHRFDRVRFNIELKSYPVGDASLLSPPPEVFVKTVMNIIKKYGMENRTTIQSFDWRILTEFRRLYKDEVLLAALTIDQPDEYCRQENVPGASPWMGGLDIDDFGGDYVKAAKAINVDIVSPYYKEVTPQIVQDAHDLGLKVIPWTINTKEEMEELLDMGVDGIITDRPDILKEVIVERKILL